MLLTPSFLSSHFPWWLGSRVVSVLDSGAEGPGLKSQPRRCRVTVLGKLFTPIHRASVHQAAKLVAAVLRVAGVTAGLAESNGSLPPGFMTHVTCRLTARNRDQLQNPTLGNRVWATATFTFYGYPFPVSPVIAPPPFHLFPSPVLFSSPRSILLGCLEKCHKFHTVPLSSKK